MAMVRYPLPITNAMLTPANANIGKPLYTSGVGWQGGATGNEEDVATATSSIANSHSAAVDAPYAPKTQAAKAAAMVPPLPILDDLGIDTGAYAGQAGRTGPVTPQAPYPDATSPPIVTNVNPGTGLAAGGLANITITGAGFTGATSVTFGGTAATAVVVVNSNTITCTSPAHAAGTVDVRVTTPKGASAIGGAADNFIYV